MIEEVLGGVESDEGFGFDWGREATIDFWEGDSRITLGMEVHGKRFYVDVQSGLSWHSGVLLTEFDCVRLRQRLGVLAEAIGLTLLT